MDIATQSGSMIDRLARAFAAEPDVAGRTMFRSPALGVGGKVFAFEGRDDRLIVKLRRERGEALVAAGVAETVTMGARTMREWFVIPRPADGDGVDLWLELSREACAYVRSGVDGR